MPGPNNVGANSPPQKGVLADAYDLAKEVSGIFFGAIQNQQNTGSNGAGYDGDTFINNGNADYQKLMSQAKQYAKSGGNNGLQKPQSQSPSEPKK